MRLLTLLWCAVGSHRAHAWDRFYVSKLFDVNFIESHPSDVQCFADDTQLYLSFKPVNATAQEEVVLAMQVYAGQVFI